jgi:hypothetical protein
MPAHEHLQNQLFTGQGSVDAQRRKRLLASSQRAMEDIDFAVDNKPYPKNEALEASDLKRWGPDPDPVDPANPTIFRFKTGWHPHINNNFYRSNEEEGFGPSSFTLPYNDRQDRADVFGSTESHHYTLNELDRDEDGPLHGLAQPIYPDRYFKDDREADSKKSHLYMSKEEKVNTRQKNVDDERKKWDNLMRRNEHIRRAYPDGNYGRD